MQLFDTNKKWWKGNTHTHTTKSDGRKNPEDVMEEYRQNGYDFLVLTDHRKQSPEQDYRGMLVLSGTELDYNHLKNQVVHITAFGLTDEIDYPKALETPEDGIREINKAGGLAIMAHPYWSLNTPDIMERMNGISGIEIYNTLSGTPWNSDRADSAAFCDVIFANGYFSNLIAADDSHFYTGESCKSYIMVNAEENTRESLQNAIREGRFYASRGPVFRQITVEGRHITVECSPAEKVVFYSNYVWVGGRCKAGNGLTAVEYDSDPGEKFVRIEVIDQNGNKAYSNPIVF